MQRQRLVAPILLCHFTICACSFSFKHVSLVQKIMYFIGLVLENLALSTDDNEDILYCLKVNLMFSFTLSRYEIFYLHC
jgi:hypothetical protein